KWRVILVASNSCPYRSHAIVPYDAQIDDGLRPCEKMHEEMIIPEEVRSAVMIRDGKYFIIQPDLASWGYEPPAAAVPVEPGFFFRSDSNDQWYTREQIAEIIEAGI